MKPKTLALILVISVLALVGSYVVITQFIFPPEQTNGSTSPEDLPLATSTSSMIFEEETRSGMDGLIDIYYPRASDGVSDDALETFNTRLEQDIIKIENDFIPEAEDAMEAAEEDSLMIGLNISYRTPSSTGRLQSVILDGYQSLGGAHGLPFNRTYVFDIEDGNFISWKDLFEPNTNPLEQFATYSRKELSTREFVGDDKEWLEEGSAPIADNYQNIFVSDEGLTIIFSAYQVAPYVAGPQEVTIPWSELKGLKAKYAPPDTMR